MKMKLFNEFDKIKANNHPAAETKKKMRKLVAAVVSVIAVVAIMVIVLANGVGSNKLAVTAKAQDLMKGVTPQNVDVSGAVSNDFINSTQNFSIDLFKNTYKSGENALVSPTSAYLALGMTANGASGSTLAAFQNVLGKYGMTADGLNKAYKAYAEALTKKKGSTKLALANSIWLNSDFNANKLFLQKNADFFGAAAEKLNFSAKNSVNVINGWVKNNTGGKFDKIIDRLDGSEVMHLIDALYFEGKWENPFDTESKPFSGSFRLDNGGAATVTYMKLSDKLDYVITKNETAVLLPYDDGRLAMLCILPQKGIKLGSYIGSMTEKTIPALTGKMGSAEAFLTFPQFKVTADNDLNGVLKSMGLGIAFGGNADFSKMGEDKEDLNISSVRQKTYLEADENKTQAAAATDVVMQKLCVNSEFAKKIDFNRPFVYALIDTKTNLPLFLGAMEKPESTLAPG